MKIETITGAALAALIGFLNALLALFLNNPEFTFGMITQAGWVGLVVGAAVQFLKDYQAISVRRLTSKTLARPEYVPD